MNMLTFIAVFLVLASATALYALSYDTRQIEARVRSAERTAERIRGEIAILRAERAYLARPERIEPVARAMGLRPIERGQIAGPSHVAAPQPAAVQGHAVPANAVSAQAVSGMVATTTGLPVR